MALTTAATHDGPAAAFRPGMVGMGVVGGHNPRELGQLRIRNIGQNGLRRRHDVGVIGTVAYVLNCVKGVPQTGAEAVLVVPPRYTLLVEKVGKHRPLETRKGRWAGRTVVRIDGVHDRRGSRVASRAALLAGLAVVRVARNAERRLRQRGCRAADEILMRRETAGLIALEHTIREHVLSCHVEIWLYFRTRSVAERAPMILLR